MIRTKEYCDICEQKYGEESEKALIIKPPGKPAFAQLIWTYYKKGLQLFKTPETLQPIISEQWLGQPNRLEFCDNHASEFNILLKAMCARDNELVNILDKLKVKDDLEWGKKQKAKTKEFNRLFKEWIKKGNRKSADRN